MLWQFASVTSLVSQRLRFLKMWPTNFSTGTALSSTLLHVHIIFSSSVSKFKCAWVNFLCLSDSYIQQVRRNYTDRNAYGMSAVSNELRDVTRIMVSNIEDVIHRGEALNSEFSLESLGSLSRFLWIFKNATIKWS